MTFAIDTGLSDQSPTRFIPDWFHDIFGDTPPAPERMMHDFGYHLIGAMQNPKKLETVRRHFLKNWEFLRELAATNPGVFDEIMTAYAERVLSD